MQEGGAEPDAKRLKPTPPDPAVVRKQVLGLGFSLILLGFSRIAAGAGVMDMAG